MRRGAPHRLLLLLALLVPILLPLTQGGCKHPSERRRERARLDSLRRDSARPVFNPYKLGQGNAQYDRERELLGRPESLVTPPNPSPGGIRSPGP